MPADLPKPRFNSSRSFLAPTWCIVVHEGGAVADPVGTAGTKQKTGSPVRVSVSFDAADYAAIKNIARDKRVSAAWVVREAVSSYLDTRTPLFAAERPENT